MKTLFFLLLTGIAFADLPRLTIEHGERLQEVRLDEVEVTVRVEGDLVETRMSLNFFNETNRNQEGEFRLPLPEGASVNHYALEVNGKMREATVIEKEQARFAYETIKARRVDPGLVEKMEGNVYRTRIFPVEPKKGKRVSIGYVQPLKKVGDQMVYRLPFGVTENIGKFQLKIEGNLGGITAELTSGAELTEDATGLSFSSENSLLQGVLVLYKPTTADQFSGQTREVNGESFAYLTGPVPPELIDRKALKPQTLTVLWDASASGYSRNLQAEIEFLGNFIEELGGVSVQLLAIHGEVEDLGNFQVKDGDWKELRAAVEGIFHDGAADWRQVDFKKLKGQQILLFGGNESAFPLSQTKPSGVFQVVRSAPGAVDKVLAKMATNSGGGVINLATLKPAEAVREALELRPRVVTLTGAVESSFSEIVDGQLRIFAKLKNSKDDQMTIALGRGGEITDPITVTMNRAGGGNALRYLWAQRRLDELVSQSSFITGQEKETVITHCQTYGLVSDFTSLIVLELMADHIQFRIPPPEPELMDEYLKGLKKKEEQEREMTPRDPLDQAWNDRIRWHKTNYPWVEVALLPRYLRVKKWTEAQTSVFEKEQLAQTNLAEFLAWKKEAEKLMREGREITNQKEFLKWADQLGKLAESGKDLGAKDPKLPEKGEFAVSIRGLVKKPQTITVKKGATLREALKKADGLLDLSSESKIALYRSGKRTIYNLKSERYEDVKLLPGDMMVALANYHHLYDGFRSSADPFAAAGSSGSSGDLKNEPAVLSEDLPLIPQVPFGLGIPGPFGGAQPREGNLPLSQTEVKEVEPPVAQKELLEEILKAENPWAAYQNQRPKMGNDLAAFAQVAEKLYEQNEPKKARRVLANFYGQTSFHIPSLRAAAYWMMQLEDYEGAEEILVLIAAETLEDALLGLDAIRLNRLADGKLSNPLFRKVIGAKAGRTLANPKNSFIVEMLMMERNRFQPKSLENLTKRLPREPQVFPSDIRILVTSSHPEGQTYLVVTEPTGQSVAGADTSLTGGRLVRGEGAAEFMVRRAMPGNYRLELSNSSRGTYQVEIFLNWGRENETHQMFTLSTDGEGHLIDAAVVKFNFGQP